MALRRVADPLLDKLACIHELIDRLDEKPAQVIDRRDVPLEELSDAELYRIAFGGEFHDEAPKMPLIPPANVRSDDPS
ncbi:hypothetical protein [Bradyrhizobium liaoningense]|uniref:hypothetical protein n=1 Tax=Bradyrhizobium liaoningense TaxID=43992 RepID=UPI001BAD403C|nr:hypothetical protein [Bradyrhizobium liaoningense]MBR0822666.1 hypothetical protein [Bradyrhizobium liaoningense]